MRKNVLHKGVICIALLLVCCFTSCAPQSNVSLELPEEDGAEEITVALCYYEPEHVKAAAKEFELKTGVKVNIKNYLDLSGEASHEVVNEDTGETREITTVEGDLGVSHYRETALAELLSGTGADIYDVAGLDFQNLGERKLLYNLKNWVQQEPELSDENVFQNLLFATEKDDALYAIPVGFTAFVMCTSTDTPDLGEQPMTWEQFFERTKDFPRNGLLLAEDDANIFLKRFYAREKSFIDEKNKTQSLNSTEMVALLKQCKQWSEEGLCSSLNSPDESFEHTPLFSERIFRNFDTILLGELPPDYPDPIKIYPLPSDAEDYKPSYEAILTMLFAINGSSEKQRTAWEFLKFMYSEEAQKHFIVEFPLNRNAFNDSIESGMELLQADLVRQGLSKIENLDVKQVRSNAIKFTENIDSVTYHTPIHTIIDDISKEYFYDKISAEEAAKKMADKVGLYLKEQS